MKRIVITALALLIAAPVAGLATFFLTPVWRWIEATTAIESIGHSGPATWCFAAVYMLVVIMGFATCAFCMPVRVTKERSSPLTSQSALEVED